MMNIENINKVNRDSTRQSYSCSRSKPLEYIYHNPILKSIRKYKKMPAAHRRERETSLKIIDLKLPVIAMPKLISRDLQNYNKAMLFKKQHPRHISIIPELLITSSNSALN